MPSLFIFHRNVERFIPRRAAAPFGPPSTQPVSRTTLRMCSRSAKARGRPEVSDPSSAPGVRGLGQPDRFCLPNNSFSSRLARSSLSSVKTFARVEFHVLFPWQPLDRDLTARTDLDFQFATPQQSHADQWIGVCFINQDGAQFAIPLYFGHIYVK